MIVCVYVCMIHISRIERFVKTSSGRSDHEKKKQQQRKKKPEQTNTFSISAYKERERERGARAIVASLALLPTIPYIFLSMQK